MDKIIIFDTTLRDGEQSPGASISIAEKLTIARQLEQLGVDVIEAGFPVASDGDFEAVSRIAKELKNSTICGLARAIENDIKQCWEAVKYAKHPRIHTFIATSPIHREAKLKMTKDEVLSNAVKAVKFAKSFCPDVEFSAEDAIRTEMDFLKKVVVAASEAGANVINIPDTVGYTMPNEFADIIKEIRAVLPSEIIISVHCHNDLGMASANSLAAILNGARQVECTINGIGERAGNAALEEIIMSLVTRADMYNISTNINTKQICSTSNMVSRFTGFDIQKNKAVVGENAFKHEAGIHQHGVIQNVLTYEIMTPESVGCKTETLVLGKHSGRHALSKRIKSLIGDVQKIDMDMLFKNFKKLADKKKQIYDDDLISLIDEQLGITKKRFEIDYIHTVSGSKTIPTATVRIKITDENGSVKIIQEASTGDGPVDACYRAINKIIGIEYILVDYRIKAISKGGDALGEVTIIIKESDNSTEIQGRGASTDIIEASAFAYISAINRIWFLRKQKKGKASGA